MKHIHRRLLALIFILSVSMAVSAQFRYAPLVGVTIDNLKFKQNLFPVDNMVGYQAGVQAELMFPGIGFGIDFGLLYNLMGAKTELGAREIWKSDGFGRQTTELHVIQVPLHLRFKWTRMNGLEDIVAPFVYGGPDFDILVGHNKIKGNEGVPNPYSYTGGDLGLSVGGGAELFKRWQVSLQYTWGMTYLLRTRKLDNMSAQNRQWAVRFAYFF